MTTPEDLTEPNNAILKYPPDSLKIEADAEYRIYWAKTVEDFIRGKDSGTSNPVLHMEGYGGSHIYFQGSAIDIFAVATDKEVELLDPIVKEAKIITVNGLRCIAVPIVNLKGFERVKSSLLNNALKRGGDV